MFTMRALATVATPQTHPHPPHPPHFGNLFRSSAEFCCSRKLTLGQRAVEARQRPLSADESAVGMVRPCSRTRHSPSPSDAVALAAVTPDSLPLHMSPWHGRWTRSRCTQSQC
jgi:hypothetical protein